MSGIGTVTVDLLVSGQPECCQQLRRDGWVFRYNDDTQCITARGRSGGDVTVVQVYAYLIADSCVKEIGEAIAMLLNGGNHTLERQR